VSTSSNLLAVGSLSAEADTNFTVAMVCVLSLEYDALTEVLDGKPRVLQHGKDPFIYTTGVLAGQKVIIACPKNYGPRDAALAVQLLEKKYGTMELIILLGICAGVPIPPERKRPIYLGDVIIGTDLVDYAHGARKNSAGLELRKMLPEKAGEKIRQMLHLLDTEAFAGDLRERSRKRLCQLSNENPRYRLLPADDDLFFDPLYHHLHRSHCPDNICDVRKLNICQHAEETSCQKLQCDRGRLARNRPSYDTTPLQIHSGVYASAGMVMRDAQVRDDLARMHKIIAFDMEATGIWDLSPHLLVIKGVCDYGDSHKTKQWQHLAAAHAACTAKAFIEVYFPKGNDDF
jgi:nucleoside phosphorylase